MVKEAEEFAKDDQELKEKIESKNQLEALSYQTRSMIDKPEMKEKLEESDLTKVNTVLNELDSWLLNEERSKSDYDNKMNELNGILQPIMMKVYQQGTEGSSTNEAVPPGGGSMPDIPEGSDSGGGGQTIDDVD